MKYNTFIGVDVSKLTIDAHLHLINVSKTFSNNEKGFASLLAWVKKHGKVSDLTKAIIAFEHTGMYSIKFAMYHNEVNVLLPCFLHFKIKQSIGIRRGKSDQVDAQRIAEYAWLHSKTLQATVLPAKGILRLQSLLTLRDRLVRDHGGFDATWKEQNKALDATEYKEMFQIYKSVIQNLTPQIKKLESQINAVIESDEKSK